MPYGVIFTELSRVKDSSTFEKKSTLAFFLGFSIDMLVFKCKILIYQLTYILYTKLDNKCKTTILTYTKIFHLCKVTLRVHVVLISFNF